MKIGVVSDSHDNLNAIADAVAALNERKVGMVIHAGDFVAPFALKAWMGVNAPLHAVYGNNDGEREGLAAACPNIAGPILKLEVEGVKIVVIHNLAKLPDRERKAADIIVHGHTHRAEAIRRDGKLYLNPGESGGWLSGKSLMAILDVPSGKTEFVNF
ncbi:MAG TPA: metallophosphoesterase [Candidatus Brocadiia bacterium]|nr:metallophosphoesterase [Candidatus Brocadiia bacterium]